MHLSIITSYMNECMICGSNQVVIHHAIPGTANRSKSDKYGLVMPLCVKCHDAIHRNPKMTTMSKIIGQLAFEREEVANGFTKEQAREKFRKEFGKSYL